MNRFVAVLLLTLAANLLQAQESPAAKTKARPPLVLYPPCPCYHDIGLGDGDTRIDAQVNAPAALLKVQLLDANGNVLQSASVDASRGGLVETHLRAPIEAVGEFRCQMRLEDNAGKEVAGAHTTIRVAPRQESRVEVGPDGFLRVGGRPEFPIGLYSAIRYPDIAKAGFTVTHNYEITTGAADAPINPNDEKLMDLLDRSWASGMRMMVELPRKAVEQGQWAQVRRRIETFRHHPGLLCWDSEERVARGTTKPANIAALYQLVHELDPDHPLVLGDTIDVIKNLQKDRRHFFPDESMDCGIWWWYPIPLGTNATTLEPPSWLTTTLSKKPLWIAIQAYEQPWKASRYPTPAEYRCMAYLSIIDGVKGLFFYTGSGEHNYLKQSAGLLNQPENSHWDYVRQLVQELRQFGPIIMAPKAVMKLTISPTDAPVEWTTRQLNGKAYLIAANKSIRAQSVRFSGNELKGHRLQALYETHQASIQGDSLTDDFAPLAVHTYEME